MAWGNDQDNAAHSTRRIKEKSGYATYSLYCELLVKRPLKETFAFFENPANLGKITPAWLSFNIVSNNLAMRAGRCSSIM